MGINNEGWSNYFAGKWSQHPTRPFTAPNASIIRNIAAWTVTNNNWVNILPVFALSASNFMDDPSMINPVTGGDVNGFKLQSQSACAGKGIPITNIQTDFWGTPRNPIAPTVGVFEIDSTSTTASEINKGTNEINFYPNPTTDILTIEATQKTLIEIINIEGQIVKMFNTKNLSTTVDISNLSTGVYILKARTDKCIVTKKFIKE